MHSFARSFFLTFAIAIFVLSFSAPVLAQDFPTNTQPAPLAEFAQAMSEPVVEPIEAGEGVIQPLDVPVEPPIGSVLDPNQDATEAGTSIVETIVRFLHKFLIENPVFSILTASIVGILKFIPGIRPGADGKGGIHSNVLAFAVAGVLWLSYTIASSAGYQSQYDTIAGRIAELAPYVVNFLLTLFGAQVVHEWSAKRNIAVLGSKRPTPAANVPVPGIVSHTVAVPAGNVTTISGIWEPVTEEDRKAV